MSPAVFVYNDHIEFFSYGNTLIKQSKEKFLVGISNPFNPELANILMKLGIIEQSGKGINTIVKAYEEDVFKFSDEYLQVVLPYNKDVIDLDTNTDENFGINLDNNLGINEPYKKSYSISF